MKGVWARCPECKKEFTHDEWKNESEIVSDGWTWAEGHKEEYCIPVEKEDAK